MDAQLPPGADPQVDEEEERIRRAFERADAKLTAQAQAAGAGRRAEKNVLERGVDLWKSAGVGIAKAGFETSDFIFGEPTEDEKWDIRKGVEQRGRELAAESPINAMSTGVAQIVTGLVGAGKLLGPIKSVQRLSQASKGGMLAVESIKAAIGSTLVLDPHEERLANLIESFPDLSNPVTQYLAADPTDSAAEGRFKNALESLGVDIALLGATKTIKFLRSGQPEEALKAIRQMEAEKAAKAVQGNKDMFGMDFTVPPEAPAPGPTAGNVAEFGMDFTGAAREAPAPGPTAGNIAEFGMDFGPSAGKVADDAVTAPVVPATGVKATPVDTATVPPPAASQAAQAPPPAAQADEVVEQIGTKPMLDEKGQPVLPTAQVAPGKIVTQAPPPNAAENILKAAEADRKAIAKYGSKEDAIAAGHDFGQKVPLPWQKLRLPGESEALVAQTVNALKPRYDRIKGGAILSDARVKSLVEEIAKEYGEDPALIIGQLAEAGDDAAKMVPQMEAAFLVGNKMFLEADNLATRIRNGALQEFGGSEAAAMEELTVRLTTALDTLAAGNSILSNAGRGLRRARSQFRISKKDLERLKELPTDRIMWVMEHAKGDAKKVSMLLNENFTRRLMRDATWHMTNGLLWMWPTHLVNVSTNALMLAARPTEKFFGSAALRLVTKDAAKRAELSSVSRQALKEYTYTISALSDGWANAVEAFKRGDSILNPHNTEYFDGTVTGIDTAPIQWKPVASVVDIAENAWRAANYRTLVGLPTRTLGAVDEFFKTLRYRSVVQAKAMVAASDRGLTGTNLKHYLQKAMDQAIDPATGRALDVNAIREAQMVSFQQDLNYETWTGSTGRALQNMRRTDPKMALVLPFLKTPINVIRYGIKLTPGLNLLQREFTDALMGKVGQEAQAHAVGQMMLGSMFAGLAAHLALNGRITGSGPEDYKLKQEMVATGWKPYSYVWEDAEGTLHYFNFGRFDPVGMSFGMVADIVAMRQNNPDQDYEDLILAAGIAMAKNLGEKTFLQNLDGAIKAMLDPGEEGPKWLGRTVGSMMPFSSLMRGHNPDPYLREARGFIDNAMRGVPGFSPTLPISMDIYGDPIERRVGVVSSQPHDIVDAEMNRIMYQTGKGVMKPSYSLDRVDLRDLTITQGPQAGKNAYQRLQELSGHLPGQPSLKELLAKEIESPLYQDLIDGDADVKGTRLNRLASLVEKYRTVARKAFLRENPEFQTLVKGRQREARGALLEKRAEKPAGQRLLEALAPQ